MKSFGLSFLIFLFVFGLCCKSDEKQMPEAQKKIVFIANDPHESFSELMKLKKHISFIYHGDHPSIAKFDINARDREIRNFSKNFNKDAIPENGYLATGTFLAEKDGIFQIFQNANNKKQKKRPGLRRADGFIQEYCWLVLSIQKMAPFYWYKIICLIEKKQENEAISCLSDFANAELLLTAPTTRTIRFIDVLMNKYDFSKYNKNKLIDIKRNLLVEINNIKNNI